MFLVMKSLSVKITVQLDMVVRQLTPLMEAILEPLFLHRGPHRNMLDSLHMWRQRMDMDVRRMRPMQRRICRCRRRHRPLVQVLTGRGRRKLRALTLIPT
jgi:hypothetical protein